MVFHAGGVDRLVGLLTSDAAKTRETAALALHALCGASPGFCSEAFTAACSAVLHARGDAAALAAMQHLYRGEAPERAAATLLTLVHTCRAPCMSTPITDRAAALS